MADQLHTADPAAWPVAPGWQPLVDAFFQGPTGQSLLGFLRGRLDAGAVVFPPEPLRAQLMDGTRVKSDQVGWYLNKARTLAVAPVGMAVQKGLTVAPAEGDRGVLQGHRRHGIDAVAGRVQ